MAQNTIDYQITTADDSKAVSSIAITVIDNAAKCIMGNATYVYLITLP
jgi:hypothetical protein